MLPCHACFLTLRFLLPFIRQLFLICQIPSYYGEAHMLKYHFLSVVFILKSILKCEFLPAVIFWQDHMTLAVLSVSWLLAACTFSWHSMVSSTLTSMKSFMHYWHPLSFWQSIGQNFLRWIFYGLLLIVCELNTLGHFFCVFVSFFYILVQKQISVL